MCVATVSAIDFEIMGFFTNVNVNYGSSNGEGYSDTFIWGIDIYDNTYHAIAYAMVNEGIVEVHDPRIQL